MLQLELLLLSFIFIMISVVVNSAILLKKFLLWLL